MFNSVSMNIRQVNKMINQELSLLTKRNIYVGGDTVLTIRNKKRKVPVQDLAVTLK